MGKTPKPLHMQVAASLVNTHGSVWEKLQEQGHTVETLAEPGPDLIIGPYAMRVTSDMLDELPTTLDLLIKGARALRYAPHAKEKGAWNKGKPNAKAKKAHKGKNTTKQVEAASTGEPTTQEVVGGEESIL